jgi:hypothetical protein
MVEKDRESIPITDIDPEVFAASIGASIIFRIRECQSPGLMTQLGSGITRPDGIAVVSGDGSAIVFTRKKRVAAINYIAPDEIETDGIDITDTRVRMRENGDANIIGCGSRDGGARKHIVFSSTRSTVLSGS